MFIPFLRGCVQGRVILFYAHRPHDVPAVTWSWSWSLYFNQNIVTVIVVFGIYAECRRTSYQYVFFLSFIKLVLISTRKTDSARRNWRIHNGETAKTKSYEPVRFKERKKSKVVVVNPSRRNIASPNKYLEGKMVQRGKLFLMST